jgi:hypothetical protein
MWYYTNMQQPLGAVRAKQLVRRILKEGEVVFAEPHMSQRMAQRRLQRLDVMNVLRAGVVREAEWENGEWRHQIETQAICVVISFPEEMLLKVVTAWRK